jgi:glycine C-acetyltransferase
MTAAALESIRQVRRQPQLVETLHANTQYLRERLASEGFLALGETNVIPVLLPTEINPKHFARYLLDNYNIWISPIWFIAKPRLRITANALHTKEDMDRLVDAMVATRDRLYKPEETMVTTG